MFDELHPALSEISLSQEASKTEPQATGIQAGIAGKRSVACLMQEVKLEDQRSSLPALNLIPWCWVIYQAFRKRKRNRLALNKDPPLSMNVFLELAFSQVNHSLKLSFTMMSPITWHRLNSRWAKAKVYNTEQHFLIVSLIPSPVSLHPSAADCKCFGVGDFGFCSLFEPSTMSTWTMTRTSTMIIQKTK